MKRLRFPLAVLATSIALVAGIAVVGLFGVRYAAAESPAGPWPFLTAFPEMAGLRTLDPAQRFAHFQGLQLSLKDNADKPMTIQVTPGKVTAASATSLSIAANDGTSKTYALTDKTVIRGRPGESGQPSLKTGEMVVVVTAAGENAARVVLDGGTEGFAPPHGFGPGRFGPPMR
ncbi:MAG: hypothetical protein U0821_17815 [Chloroflexota bacterium]